MTYETVNMEAKEVVGLKARTNNLAPDMAAVIGGLWNRFYQEGVHAAINSRKNSKAFGIYTNYDKAQDPDYDVIVACEVGKGYNQPADTISFTIPAGKYAKFVVKGEMHQAVAKAWGEIWQMDLPRTFECDFEEYQNGDMEHTEIHIYISIK